jgi:hypothetical protein
MNQQLRSFQADVDDVNKSDRTIVAKISVGCVDRYNTVISPDGIDVRDYVKNPCVLFEHGRDITRGSMPVGKNLWIKVDKSGTGRLIAKTKFRDDDFSQALWECYSDGTLRGWSVSVLPTDFGAPSKEEIRSRPDLERCETIFRRSILAEYSCVAVPGCQEALTDEQLRTYGAVISRGIPLPQDVVEAVERLSKIAEDRDAEEGTEDRMSSCDGPSGGYLIKPEDRDEEKGEEDRDKPADDKKKSEEDEKPGDEADGDEDDSTEKRYIKHEGDKWIVYSEAGKPLGEYGSEAEAKKRLEQIEYFKHKDEGRSIIELPSLENARTFQQIYHLLLNEEIQHREFVLKKMQEQIDWYFGKV